jgi:hypothetical protein
MPNPEIKRMNMRVDPNRRVRPVARRRLAGGGSIDARGAAGARGAATDGPVGDVRKRFPSFRPSSTDTAILWATTAALIYVVRI